MPRRDLKAGVDETVAAAASVPRWPSGMFSGAADSGIWPGMTRGMQGATAFITPSTYGFIFIWYLTGALTNTYSRQTMLAFKSPPYLSLTLMQHVMAMLCGTFGIRVLQLRPYKPLPPQAHTFAFYRLLFVYSAGFCLTNGSFGKVNASFVDTIKAGEPIATVLLTTLFLPGEKVTLSVFLSLLPIVCGVGISSMSDTSFNLLGFCMAMGSNICFSARSICAKLLRSTLGKQMDNANLFVHINMYCTLALLPIVLAFEGPLLLHVMMDFGRPAKLFLMNGVFYYLNNQMNFLVLEKVDAVTHGLINCGRRVANISFAIMWFGTPVTLYNGAGICLALSGAYL
jgi:solute carrier family 35 protein E1